MHYLRLAFLFIYAQLTSHTLIDEDEDTCQGCGGNYDEDDTKSKKAWIRCDGSGCWRWYHY